MKLDYDDFLISQRTAVYAANLAQVLSTLHAISDTDMDFAHRKATSLTEQWERVVMNRSAT